MSSWLLLWMGTWARADDDRSLRWLEDPDAPEVVEWRDARTAEALAWLDADEELDDLTRLVTAWRVHRNNRQSVVDAVDGALLVLHTWPDPANEGEPERKLWRVHRSLEVQREDGAYTVDVTDVEPESWWPVCKMDLSTDGRWLLWGRRRPEPDPLDPNKKTEPCLHYLTEVGSGTHRFLGEYERGFHTFTADGTGIQRMVRKHGRTHVTALDFTGDTTETVFSRWGCWSLSNLRTGSTLVWKAARCRKRSRGWRPHSLVVEGEARRYRIPRTTYRWAGEAGDTLLMQVEKGAEANTRVVAITPGWSRSSGWETWLEDTELEPFQRVAWIEDRFLVTSVVDGAVHLTERAKGGEVLGTPVGGPFSHAWMQGTSLDLARVHGVSPRGQEVWLRDRGGAYTPVEPHVPGVPAELFQVLAVSADGTEVPVSVVMPKGLVPDADTPVWLKVYGGFGTSMRAHVDIASLLWMQMGGIVATVHARGGSERGEAWHEQARKADLDRTFDDVVAAGRWFVDAGWSSEGRLAMSGFSNGGLTVAATVAREPHLFGAVLTGSGVHDLIRGPAMGRWWPAEYGRPADPGQRAVLRAISPVHAAPASLPPVWITTGASDPTVTPSHSYKLWAAWKDIEGGPVFLRATPWPSHIGHLGDKKREAAMAGYGVAEQDREVAERVLFVVRALGLDTGLLFPPPPID